MRGSNNVKEPIDNVMCTKNRVFWDMTSYRLVHWRLYTTLMMRRGQQTPPKRRQRYTNQYHVRFSSETVRTSCTRIKVVCKHLFKSDLLCALDCQVCCLGCLKILSRNYLGDGEEVQGIPGVRAEHCVAVRLVLLGFTGNCTVRTAKYLDTI